MMDQLHHKAVISAGTSVATAGISIFGNVDLLLQRGAAIVAIISGIAAVVYYALGVVERLRNLHK